MLARPRELLPVVALFLCACPEPRQPRPAADGPPRRSARPDVRSRGSRDARREPSKIAPPGPRTLALGEPPALPVPARKGGLPRPVPRGRAAIRALRPDGDTRLETLIALESPISGTVKPGASRRRRLSALPVTRFVPHQALDAHPVGAGWVAVLASTGLWLHEGRTLARRVLLVPPPVAAMDATRDGRKLAYARCTAGWRRRCRLEVVSFPGLKRLARAAVEEPVRVRFSPDGQRVVSVSHYDKSVRIVAVPGGRARRVRWKEDVNDAVLLDEAKQLVAMADDSDNAILYDTRRRRVLFNSHRYKQALIARRFVPERDQHAVAYDPESDTLLSGGDDNVVWRFRGLLRREVPRLVEPLLRFNGNIVEIALGSGGEPLVATDGGTVSMLRPDGTVRAKLGGDRTTALRVRVGLGPAPGDSVLVALDGLLLRWMPRAGKIDLSPDCSPRLVRYPSTLASSEGARDTMLARCRRRGRGLGIRCAVHRVALEPPRLEAVSELVSTITSDYPVYWVEFGSGRRALASCSRAMKLRLWYAPPGGALRRPAEPGPACGGQFAQKDGKRVVGYIERMGQLHEIDFGAARARPAGVLPPPLRATERLVWDGRAGRWKLERMGRGWGRRRSRSRRSRSR